MTNSDNQDLALVTLSIANALAGLALIKQLREETPKKKKNEK